MDAPTAIKDILTSIATNGWNTSAGEDWINYALRNGKMQYNFNGSGLPDVSSKPQRPLRTDPLVTLRSLESFWQWQHVTGDTSFSAQTMLRTPVVKKDT